MKLKFKNLPVVVVILTAIGIALAHAGDYDEAPAPSYYKTSTSLRDGYAVGGHVEVFGGANIAQTGNINVQAAEFPGVNASGSTKSQAGGVVGIKAGYTWDVTDKNDEGGSPVANSNFAVLPSLDYEFFWTGITYKAAGHANDADTSLSANMNAYVFSLDPTLKFQIGIFRPYFGFGIGGADLAINDVNVSISTRGSKTLNGSENDWAFAVQGLAGVEIFVSRRWALGIDYKYLNLINPSFGGNGNSVHSSSIGESLITAGIHYYF